MHSSNSIIIQLMSRGGLLRSDMLTLCARHIDSYNFFVEHEIKEIVRANRTIRSDVDSNFWLEYAADLLPLPSPKRLTPSV